MYSLSFSPAYFASVLAEQKRDAVEHSRLARTAKLAREGRGEPDAPQRHQQRPRHRSRFVWLLGLRSNIAI